MAAGENAEGPVGRLTKLEGAVTANTAVLESHTADLQELKVGQDDLRKRLDQLRKVFGLNGSTSPDEVKASWVDLTEIVKREREEDRHREAWSLVARDIAVKMHLPHFWVAAKYLAPFVLGAFVYWLFTVFGSHIPTDLFGGG